MTAHTPQKSPWYSLLTPETEGVPSRRRPSPRQPAGTHCGTATVPTLTVSAQVYRARLVWSTLPPAANWGAVEAVGSREPVQLAAVAATMAKANVRYDMYPPE